MYRTAIRYIYFLNVDTFIDTSVAEKSYLKGGTNFVDQRNSIDLFRIISLSNANCILK